MPSPPLPSNIMSPSYIDSLTSTSEESTAARISASRQEREARKKKREQQRLDDEKLMSGAHRDTNAEEEVPDVEEKEADDIAPLPWPKLHVQPGSTGGLSFDPTIPGTPSTARKRNSQDSQLNASHDHDVSTSAANSPPASVVLSDAFDLGDMDDLAGSRHEKSTPTPVNVPASPRRPPSPYQVAEIPAYRGPRSPSPTPTPSPNPQPSQTPTPATPVVPRSPSPAETGGGAPPKIRIAMSASLREKLAGVKSAVAHAMPAGGETPSTAPAEVAPWKNVLTSPPKVGTSSATSTPTPKSPPKSASTPPATKPQSPPQVSSSSPPRAPVVAASVDSPLKPSLPFVEDDDASDAGSVKSTSADSKAGSDVGEHGRTSWDYHQLSPVQEQSERGSISTVGGKSSTKSQRTAASSAFISGNPGRPASIKSISTTGRQLADGTYRTSPTKPSSSSISSLRGLPKQDRSSTFSITDDSHSYKTDPKVLDSPYIAKLDSPVFGAGAKSPFGGDVDSISSKMSSRSSSTASRNSRNSRNPSPVRKMSPELMRRAAVFENVPDGGEALSAERVTSPTIAPPDSPGKEARIRRLAREKEREEKDRWRVMELKEAAQELGMSPSAHSDVLSEPFSGTRAPAPSFLTGVSRTSSTLSGGSKKSKMVGFSPRLATVCEGYLYCPPMNCVNTPDALLRSDEWIQRYSVLTAETLEFRPTDSNGQQSAVVAVIIDECIAVDGDMPTNSRFRPFALIGKHGDRSLFACASRRERAEWIMALENEIEASAPGIRSLKADSNPNSQLAGSFVKLSSPKSSSTMKKGTVDQASIKSASSGKSSIRTTKGLQAAIDAKIISSSETMASRPFPLRSDSTDLPDMDLYYVEPTPKSEEKDRFAAAYASHNAPPTTTAPSTKSRFTTQSTESSYARVLSPVQRAAELQMEAQDLFEKYHKGKGREKTPSIISQTSTRGPLPTPPPKDPSQPRKGPSAHSRALSDVYGLPSSPQGSPKKGSPKDDRRSQSESTLNYNHVAAQSDATSLKWALGSSGVSHRSIYEPDLRKVLEIVCDRRDSLFVSLESTEAHYRKIYWALSEISRKVQRHRKEGSSEVGDPLFDVLNDKLDYLLQTTNLLIDRASRPAAVPLSPGQLETLHRIEYDISDILRGREIDELANRAALERIDDRHSQTTRGMIFTPEEEAEWRGDRQEWDKEARSPESSDATKIALERAAATRKLEGIGTPPMGFRGASRAPQRPAGTASPTLNFPSSLPPLPGSPGHTPIPGIVRPVPRSPELPMPTVDLWGREVKTDPFARNAADNYGGSSRERTNTTNVGTEPISRWSEDTDAARRTRPLSNHSGTPNGRAPLSHSPVKGVVSTPPHRTHRGTPSTSSPRSTASGSSPLSKATLELLQTMQNDLKSQKTWAQETSDHSKKVGAFIAELSNHLTLERTRRDEQWTELLDTIRVVQNYVGNLPQELLARLEVAEAQAQAAREGDAFGPVPTMQPNMDPGEDPAGGGAPNRPASSLPREGAASYPNEAPSMDQPVPQEPSRFLPDGSIPAETLQKFVSMLDDGQDPKGEKKGSLSKKNTKGPRMPKTFAGQRIWGAPEPVGNRALRWGPAPAAAMKQQQQEVVKQALEDAEKAKPKENALIEALKNSESLQATLGGIAEKGDINDISTLSLAIFEVLRVTQDLQKAQAEKEAKEKEEAEKKKSKLTDQEENELEAKKDEIKRLEELTSRTSERAAKLDEVISKLAEKSESSDAILKQLLEETKNPAKAEMDPSITEAAKKLLSQFKSGVDAEVKDFRGQLADEVKRMFTEVGRLREERKALQVDISELLSFQAKHGGKPPEKLKAAAPSSTPGPAPKSPGLPTVGFFGGPRAPRG